jgi:hypothetical protein
VARQICARISSPTDSVPGTGIALGAWRFGVDPNPTIPAATGELLPGSTGRLMDPKNRNPVTEEFNLGYHMRLLHRRSGKSNTYTPSGLYENKTVNINPRIAVLGTDPVTR